MRVFVRSLLMIGCLLAPSWSLGQGEPTAVFPPPAELIEPASAEPSEPWSPSGAVGELPLPQAGDAASPSAEAPKVIVEEEKHWYTPIWLGPAPWDTGIEFGLNGSSGTSESLSIHTGMYIKRESRFSKLDFDSDYNTTVSGGDTTQDNAKIDVTNDWLLHETSPWTLFAATDLFYDQFAAFDLQTSLNSGVGYRWIHTPALDFMTRCGGGATGEFGGPNDRWAPESRFGFEYGQRVAPMQKLYAKFDYYPDWDEVGEYRMVADAGWEIELVQPSNLSLKLSATDRYDSTPDGADPHLVNYSVLLLLKL
jgi:hypothetical protein